MRWFWAVLAADLGGCRPGQDWPKVSLRAVLAETPHILMVRVQSLDLNRPAMILVTDEQLKGKLPFARLVVQLKGDAEATREKQVTGLLTARSACPWSYSSTKTTRLSLPLPTRTAPGFRWPEPSGGEVFWSFAHVEPYLRRTFKGTTAELKQTLRDGLAGKKLPDVDPQEIPGLGPEVETPKKENRERKKEEGKKRVFSPRFNSPFCSVDQPLSILYPHSLPPAGPIFAVIPSVLAGGPLALLAMLFPALFGGLILFFRRWMVAITVLSLNSTLYLLQDWFLARLVSRHLWWNGEPALWLSMSMVALLGVLVAWRRHVRRLHQKRTGFASSRLPAQGKLPFWSWPVPSASGLWLTLAGGWLTSSTPCLAPRYAFDEDAADVCGRSLAGHAARPVPACRCDSAGQSAAALARRGHVARWHDGCTFCPGCHFSRPGGARCRSGCHPNPWPRDPSVPASRVALHSRASLLDCFNPVCRGGSGVRRRGARRGLLHLGPCLQHRSGQRRGTLEIH